MFDAQSKMRVCSKPVPPSAVPPALFFSAVPPTTTSCPPGSRVWNAQNSAVAKPGVPVNVPVAGFHRRALVSPSSLSQMSTSPVGLTARWTATKLFQSMRPDHEPGVAGAAPAIPAEAISAPANPMAASVRLDVRPTIS